MELWCCCKTNIGTLLEKNTRNYTSKEKEGQVRDDRSNKNITLVLIRFCASQHLWHNLIEFVGRGERVISVATIFVFFLFSPLWSEVDIFSSKPSRGPQTFISRMSCQTVVLQTGGCLYMLGAWYIRTVSRISLMFSLGVGVSYLVFAPQLFFSLIKQ